MLTPNQVDPPNRHSPEALPVGTSIRQALPSDADAIHVLMRPFVMRRLLLSRTEAEIIELTRHGFMAVASGNNQAVRLLDSQRSKSTALNLLSSSVCCSPTFPR